MSISDNTVFDHQVTNKILVLVWFDNNSNIFQVPDMSDIQPETVRQIYVEGFPLMVSGTNHNNTHGIYILGILVYIYLC